MQEPSGWCMINEHDDIIKIPGFCPLKAGGMWGTRFMGTMRVGDQWSHGIREKAPGQCL